jgi:hypothetical protein
MWNQNKEKCWWRFFDENEHFVLLISDGSVEIYSILICWRLLRLETRAHSAQWGLLSSGFVVTICTAPCWVDQVLYVSDLTYLFLCYLLLKVDLLIFCIECIQKRGH